MASLRRGCTGGLAGSDKHSFGRSARGSAKIVYFRTPDRVPPSLDLSLHVCPGEELIILGHVSVQIYTPVAGGRVTETFTEAGTV